MVQRSDKEGSYYLRASSIDAAIIRPPSERFRRDYDKIATIGSARRRILRECGAQRIFQRL